VHDNQVALPLSQITERRISHYYDLMDAAYWTVNTFPDK